MGLPLILWHILIISLKGKLYINLLVYYRTGKKKRNDLKMLFAFRMYILNLLTRIYISEEVLYVSLFLYTPRCTAMLNKCLLEKKIILKDSDF